jgi:DNA-directed RNA polymerase subunit omega
MLDAFREETIVRKVGGRFRLSSLIQKRMVALNRGARPLVEVMVNNPMLIVVEEILNDKIYLDSTGNVAITDGAPDLDQILQEPGPDFSEL